MPQVVLVNEYDEIIGYKNRQDITKTDIYRVSALWLTNSKGEFLIAQRSLLKLNSPGKRGPAVAGTIEEGESYDTNIEKEIKEELGITLKKIIKGPKIRKETGDKNYFQQRYLSKEDFNIESLTLQREEVEAVQRITQIEFEKSYKKNPDLYLKTMPGYVKDATERDSLGCL